MRSPHQNTPSVVELCHKYKEQLLGSPQAARTGIMPLCAALQRLAPSPEHLTPLHADVLQMSVTPCLLWGKHWLHQLLHQPACEALQLFS